jgi:hypothetical protein
MSDDGPRCQSCGKPWAYHKGCQELCAENQRLTLDRDEARAVSQRWFYMQLPYDKVRAMEQYPWLKGGGGIPTAPKVCPKCGADEIYCDANGRQYGVRYACGSVWTEYLYESPRCKLLVAEREIERLRLALEEIAAFEDPLDSDLDDIAVDSIAIAKVALVGTVVEREGEG